MLPIVTFVLSIGCWFAVMFLLAEGHRGLLARLGIDPNFHRSARELGHKARWAFDTAKESPAYQRVHEIPRPLVSVCIATYNRSRLLTERAIPSILRQSHSNLELIVVGDGCTDDTAERVLAIRDPRIRFVNLPMRGDYPEDPHKRWTVAGTQAINHALSLARGEYITHLDDDDEHDERRLEILIGTIRHWNADLVYHPFEYEAHDGEWKVNQAEEFAYAKVTTSSIFYHRWFRQLGWDPLAYRYDEPGDWNRLRKLKYLGAKTVRSPHVLLRHYREQNQAATDFRTEKLSTSASLRAATERLMIWMRHDPAAIAVTVML